ncbi:MAG: HAD family hydrolase [Promethearchaeota archaeon]
MFNELYSDYCVIFDMDGVLADTGPIHFESWVKLAEEIGVIFTRRMFEQTFGQQSPTITRKIVGSDVKDSLIKKWADLKESYYRELVKNKLKLLPGVLNILKELQVYDFKIALGSSGPFDNVSFLLAKLNIKQFFNTIITAEDVKRGKPEPDVFLAAAKSLNLKPKNCIVIEDAPVGIDAARAAGMLCIALTTTHKKEELDGAQLIIKDLSEISVKDIIILFKKN